VGDVINDDPEAPEVLVAKDRTFFQSRDLELFAFDTNGDRMIVKPFNQEVALKLSGVEDPLAIVRPSFEV
jgi:hypothetical protein